MDNLPIPSMVTSFLPPQQVVDVTQQYSQNQLAPTNSGCRTCSQPQSFYRMDADSRRNLAGLRGVAGLGVKLGGLGGVAKLATLGNVGRALGRTGLGADPLDGPGVPIAIRISWGVLSTASMVASAYHGLKRHRGSVGWAVVWGIMGALFPVLTPVVAVVEGYAKPMRR